MIAREWIDQQMKTWVRGHGERMTRFEHDIFPWIGSRPIADLTAPELLATVRRIEKRGALGHFAVVEWQTYRPQTGNPAMVVTLGSRAGVTCLPKIGTVKAGWFNRKVKAAHMLVPKYRKLLGV